MKTQSLLVFIILLISACGNNKADQPAAEEYSIEMGYSWQATVNDSTGRLEMKKQETAGPDSLSPQAVIDFINTTNTYILLKFVNTSNDTVYIKIPEATYLTQQMGSTGSTIYLAQLVYNLTEIPGTHYVNLDFEEGDHAAPGTFSRKSFNDQ